MANYLGVATDSTEVLNKFSTIFPNVPSLGLNPSAIPSRSGPNAQRPWVSTADVLLYVDPANGNDINSGATQTSALKTFAAAASRIPYILFHKARIYCLDGTYNEAPIVTHIWMTASRWANFQVIGHTPNNPAYTDTHPENVVFSFTDSSGGRAVTVWSSMPGSNYNTSIEGVTIDAFWPYDVTCQVQNCIIQNGGGATNNYGVGGHGGTVSFSNVLFKNLPSNGLVCEATDFAHFHFNQCTLDATCLAPFASVKNQSVVTCKNMAVDLSTSFCEPGSFLLGGNAPRLNQYGLGIDQNTAGLVMLAGGTPGTAGYNEGGQIECYGKDAAGANGGSVLLYFGSRLVANTSAKLSVSYSNASGTTEVFRVTNLGIAKPATGLQLPAVAKSSTSGINGTLFLDSADNFLKWRDSAGNVRGFRSTVAASAVAQSVSNATVGTTETTVATISLPALGPNSAIIIRRAHSATNNANAKNFIARINGTSVGSYNMASTASSVMEMWIANRGATNSQLVTPATISSSLGTSTSNFLTTAIDLSAASTLTLSVQFGATGTDTITLESYVVEVINAP